MPKSNNCPCCGRHCDVSDLHCDQGRAYFRADVDTGEGQSDLPGKCHDGHYDTMEMDQKLVMNLRDLGHMIRFLFEGKGSQKRVLIILHETGCMTQRELTGRMRIQPGSASEVIGKLESAGLIQRTPSHTDRRTADVQLTDLGRVRAEEAANQRKARHREMFSCLTDQEKTALLAIAEKLNADWDNRYREGDRELRSLDTDGNGLGPHGCHGFHRS